MALLYRDAKLIRSSRLSFVNLENEKDILLRVNAHKNSELRHILPIIGRIEKLGLKDIVIVVTPEKL